MSLRPIGTEFWYQFPMSTSSTEAYASRFLYRVVRHVSVRQHGKVLTTEELKPIEMEKVYPESVRFCECGSGLVYQFPPEQTRPEGKK